MKVASESRLKNKIMQDYLERYFKKKDICIFNFKLVTLKYKYDIK